MPISVLISTKMAEQPNPSPSPDNFELDMSPIITLVSEFHFAMLDYTRFLQHLSAALDHEPPRPEQFQSRYNEYVEEWLEWTEKVDEIVVSSLGS